jgi:hypothetical protein
MTTTPKPGRKHTAANTPALARVKAMCNAPIYRATLEAYNAGGREAAMEYVGRMMYREEIRAGRVAELFRD